MVRLPLTSTLFPYTTLFRSRVELPFPFGSQILSLQRGYSWVFVGIHPIDFYESHVHQCSPEFGETGTISPNSGEQDRKSTRLNSSHQIISYAVFCLKKKKTC